MWEERNKPYILTYYPAWELCAGSYWQEPLNDWHTRWLECGGKLYEGRMIAATWSNIWERISKSFSDSLNTPYPPYARSSCTRWSTVKREEAIRLGVFTEAEHEAQIEKLPPPPPLLGKDGNPIPTELLEELVRALKSEQ